MRAGELTGFLASDGFEWAFQQNHSVDELAAMNRQPVVKRTTGC